MTGPSSISTSARRSRTASSPTGRASSSTASRRWERCRRRRGRCLENHRGQRDRERGLLSARRAGGGARRARDRGRRLGGVLLPGVVAQLERHRAEPEEWRPGGGGEGVVSIVLLPLAGSRPLLPPALR